MFRFGAVLFRAGTLIHTSSGADFSGENYLKIFYVR